MILPSDSDAYDSMLLLKEKTDILSTSYAISVYAMQCYLPMTD